MKKVIKFVVEIESDDELNLDELAVGKYDEDETDSNTTLLLSEGKLGDDKFFRVTQYLKVEDVTEQLENKKNELIAVQMLNNMFEGNIKFKTEFSKLDKDEQKDIDKDVLKSI